MRTRTRFVRAVTMLAVIASLTSLQPSASGGGFCAPSFSSATGVLTILCDADGSNPLTIARDGFDLEVDGQPVTDSSSGQAATIANTTQINVDLGDAFDRLVLDLFNGLFINEVGALIPVSVTFGDDGDALEVNGTNDPDVFRSGDAGLDLNGDDIADVTYVDVAPFLKLRGNQGDDVLDIAGSPGTGDPADAGSQLDGDEQNDTLIGVAGQNQLVGASGEDVLIAHGAADLVLAGTENDDVDALDGTRSVIQLDCDTGDADRATVDVLTPPGPDAPTNCEFVDADDDGDGIAEPEDCDDTDAAVKPGVTEVGGNDVDEDCNGSKKVVDKDADQVPDPTDCDDSDRKIKPGATEIADNPRDEDCNGIAAGSPFGTLSAKIAARWNRNKPWFDTFDVRNLAGGSIVDLRCAGADCPVGRRGFFVDEATGQDEIDLGPFFKKRRLAVGTVITVTVTAPAQIGKHITYTTRKGKPPAKTTRCLPPGTTTPQAC